jgi:hypothetical protein
MGYFLNIIFVHTLIIKLTKKGEHNEKNNNDLIIISISN